MNHRTARLTATEDKAWVFAFGYYLDRGHSQRRADELAWRDLQAEYPRLRRFDGCQALTASKEARQG